MVDKSSISNEQYVDVANDEEIVLVRSRIGTMRPVVRNNEAASRDAIRHFVDGIGDPNPMWRDLSYAANTRFGCIMAPPTFLNAILPAQWHEGFPKLRAFVVGCDWEWFEPIRVNDVFTVTNTFEDFQVKKAEPVGERLFLQTGRMRYYNQRGDLTGACRWTNMQKEFGKAKEGGSFEKYSNTSRHVYTQKELDAIEKTYQDEEIRGAIPRYWDDVIEGEKIRPVVKGPTTFGDMLSFFVGISWQTQAHALSMVRRTPEMCLRDTKTNVLLPRGGVHLFDEIAAYAGLPSAFDMGIQRLCWFGHMLTNWMGDDGFLKKLSVQFREFNFLYNTTWCHGKVTRKYMENGLHFVDCDIWSENQVGRKVDAGTATVALLSKNVHE
jgi:acyl dehydratase